MATFNFPAEDVEMGESVVTPDENPTLSEETFTICMRKKKVESDQENEKELIANELGNINSMHEDAEARSSSSSSASPSSSVGSKRGRSSSSSSSSSSHTSKRQKKEGDSSPTRRVFTQRKKSKKKLTQQQLSQYGAPQQFQQNMGMNQSMNQGNSRTSGTEDKMEEEYDIKQSDNGGGRRLRKKRTKKKKSKRKKRKTKRKTKKRKTKKKR